MSKIEVGCTVRTDNPWPIEGKVLERRGKVNDEQYWLVKSGVTTLSLKEGEMTVIDKEENNSYNKRK